MLGIGGADNGLNFVAVDDASDVRVCDLGCGKAEMDGQEQDDK